MNKYRIVTNGHAFKVQRKFLFFWVDAKREISPDCFITMYYATKADAEYHIKLQLEKDKKENKKWRPI